MTMLAVWLAVLLADFFDDIGGFAGGIVSWLTGGISDIAERLWNAVKALVNWVEDIGRQGLNEVFYQLRGMFDWAYHQVLNIPNMIGDAISNVPGLFEQVGSWLSDHVLDIVHFLIDPLASVIGWLTDHVNEVLDFIGHFAEHVFDIVGDAGGWLGDQVRSIVGDMLGGINDVLDVIRKAWDWLVYFATHPFDYLRGLIDDLFHQARSWVAEHLVATLESEGSAVEDWMSRLLGR